MKSKAPLDVCFNDFGNHKCVVNLIFDFSVVSVICEIYSANQQRRNGSITWSKYQSHISVSVTCVSKFYCISQLISELRHCLRWTITTTIENQNEIAKSQKEVFQCIVRSFTASKQIYDIWLKTIQTTLLDNQKSIDLIILLIMIKVNEDKTYYIEQLVSIWISLMRPPIITHSLQIRKKIKSDQYNLNILEEIVEEFVFVLPEYLSIFISILDSLFRDKTPSVVAFASHGFKWEFNIQLIILLEIYFRFRLQSTLWKWRVQ